MGIRSNTMTTTFNQWIRMLDSYSTLREALDAVRRLERDRFRKQVYQVNKDQETGRYYIEFRKKI
jgi:hypothetical protein